MTLQVLLVQLPVPNNPLTNVPLAAGYLKAYAHSQGLLDQVQIELLPRAIADYAGDALLVEQIVEYAPDLLGFSLYTWNSERSLEIAQRVRQRLPDLMVVVGGPEVQHDNTWLCEHPAVDLAIIGEGEQAFADILVAMSRDKGPVNGKQGSVGAEECGNSAIELRSISNYIFEDRVRHGTNIPDLSILPSPYLLGYLELVPDSMLMLEISRWCPYSCSFCLYGRNMGSKLGKRYFPLERLLSEIQYGREHGLTHIHFIEANLNLVPIFQPLMQALADLNADGKLALYAELRAEHLGEDVVAALVLAGLREAEVGLQSANPAALRAVQRRTDLSKWAAGTRRLYEHGVDVLLDVIIGLPMDDEAGLEATLDFIEREQLRAFDAFTLQVLPGTALHQEAERYGLRFQERPPYYVLATQTLDFAMLRQLRRSLKQRAGVDINAIEGCPAPRYSALQSLKHGSTAAATISDASKGAGHVPASSHMQTRSNLQKTDTDYVCYTSAVLSDTEAINIDVNQLASHVDIIGSWAQLQAQQGWLEAALRANPSSIFDIYILFSNRLLDAEELRTWHEQLPYQPGYLDRIAVYKLERPEPGHMRVSPRLFLLVPWTCEIEPNVYAGIANLIWEYQLNVNEEPPLAAWQAAGGEGVFVRGRLPAEVAAWREQSGLALWDSRDVQ